MEILNEATAAATAARPNEPVRSGFGALTSNDFLSLMLTQLQNQDPLEPASNEQLMQQFATIREIEMSVSVTEALQALTDQQSTVTEALKSLTGHQRFSAASSLIGKYVRGAGADPLTGQSGVEGLVRAVRFDNHGQALLELSGGRTLPIAAISDVTEFANLIGQSAEFLEPNERGGTERRTGAITAVESENGEPAVLLDVGELLPKRVLLKDVVAIQRNLSVETGASGAASEA